MDLIFERGNEAECKGHSILYFRDSNDQDEIWATYIVLLPITVEVSKYVPPFLMNQVSDIGANDLSAFAFPPAPEKIESREHLDVIAKIRSDDILYGGVFDSKDIQSGMLLVNEAVQKYADFYDLDIVFENSIDYIVDSDNSKLDVNNVIYEFMSTNDKLSELTKMIGRLRFAIEGKEKALAEEAENDIESLSKHLPTEYEVAKITNAAKSSDAFGSKLTDLWLKRCFHLTQQEFVEIGQIDEEIKRLESNKNSI
ncbi:MAG: hypothetical protein CL758_08010 [Chloroflexi bacterium]|nr:hypothetical protein [Chloroflexota bacterium]|tara:strand:+ start:11308 stop:12072 length:765 start_codon:yes stop_codon:yes gene_type:complete